MHFWFRCYRTPNYTGNASSPQVSVRKVGDACGSLDVPATRSILAAQHQGPEQAAPSLPTTAPAARTYDIDCCHPVQAGVSTDLRG